MVTKSYAEQLEIISRGTVDLLPPDLLEKKLKRSLKENKPLIVKQGFDPTAPDIHLGHTVGLRKLRQFQDLGHQVVFLIGDFTGLIGDPTGRSETRKQLTHDEVLENAKTYTDQAFMILDRDRTDVKFNSKWLMDMNFAEVLRLTATQTVAQLIERDDFNKRYTEGKPISLLEFIYPLAQGYDSVALKADVEVGGTEQKFNLLMARDIQRQYGQEPQVILTTPILEGIDGVEKMSKSLGNYIGISEPPEEIFGKTMKIPDGLIYKYFELVSSYDAAGLSNVKARLADTSVNPSHLKRELGRNLVEQFHNADAAAAAEQHFDTIFVQKDRPDDIETMEIKASDGELWIVKALKAGNLVESNGAAKRLIAQGGLKIDGEKVTDMDLKLAPRAEPYEIKAGKRKFLAIKVV